MARWWALLRLQIPDPLGEDFCFFGTHLICLAFVRQNGTMTALPTLGGNNGTVNYINNHNQVAGLAEIPLSIRPARVRNTRPNRSSGIRVFPNNSPPYSVIQTVPSMLSITKMWPWAGRVIVPRVGLFPFMPCCGKTVRRRTSAALEAHSSAQPSTSTIKVR